MNHLLKKYFGSNIWVVLAIILVIELIYNLTINYYVLSDKVVYDSLGEQLTLEEIDAVMGSVKSNIVLFILYGLLQQLGEMLLIALAILIGTLLLQYTISFKQIFAVVVKSFMVFTISRIVYILYINFQGVSKFEDLKSLPKFSLAGLIGEDKIPPSILFPVQLLNLFQFCFIFLLVFGLNQIETKSYGRWTALVLSTYGVGLVIASVLTVFLLGL